MSLPRIWTYEILPPRRGLTFTNQSTAHGTSAIDQGISLAEFGFHLFVEGLDVCLGRNIGFLNQHWKAVRYGLNVLSRSIEGIQVAAN